MTKTIIGISANKRTKVAVSEMPLTYASHGYATGVQLAGGVPLLLPISDDLEIIQNYISVIDKLILTGGQNVHPDFYKENLTIDSEDFDYERDRFEFALIKEAIRQNKPIFGVCRGMQLINVAMGGSLNQSIKDHWLTPDLPKRTHPITIKNGSVLETIYKTNPEVNSYHRQSIKKLGDGLDTIAKSKDGVIEAIQHTKLPILGVQWHPEFTIPSRDESVKLFDYIVNRFK